MNKIFRKNQLVITALALMIAVAGYFSYMNNDIEDSQIAASVGETVADGAVLDVLEEDYEISDEEELLAEDIFTDEGTGEEVAQMEYVEDENIVADASDVSAEDAAGAENVDNPGEAVLTSTSVANLDYAAEMKLNREQIRSKNKESLLEIVNNDTIEESVKQDAINKMIAMTDITEREAAAEMLLEAKGFTDVVVSIMDDNCDVVLNMGEVTDAKRAQVEDIVKRKTNISADKIVITPIVVGEVDGE